MGLTHIPHIMVTATPTLHTVTASLPKITEAQTPQWSVFAQAFSADREKRATLCRDAMDRAKEMRSASLLDTISMTEAQLAQRLDSLRSMKAALQPLYASLSKEQKKTIEL
jgi:LTXXQ motif family protein